MAEMTESTPVEAELTLPAEYNNFPLQALRTTTRLNCSRLLNLKGNVVVVNDGRIKSEVMNDYSGLAELGSFDYLVIMNMKRQENPSMEFLDLWTKSGGTVGKLWMYLNMMGRLDIMSACIRQIVQDCAIYDRNQQIRIEAERNTEQDSTVSTSEMQVDETLFATVQDVRNRQRTFYDAFICYSADDENDRTFLFSLIDELENKRNLKLFVPGRDDLPGTAEHTITAYLIEKRCKRVIILISRQFSQSAACDFQVKFAHSLSPGARSKKLIPVILKNTPIQCIPEILRFLAACDLTRSDMGEWVWDRMYAAVSAPVGPVTYFEEDTSDPFDMSDMKLQLLRYPSQRRLVDYEDV